MGEKEQTTKTPCWFQHGYFQTAPHLEPFCDSAPPPHPHPKKKKKAKPRFNSQESWGWEAQVLGQCLQISAYFSLRGCGQEHFPTMSCLFCSCPGPGLVRSCTSCWRDQAALWICIFSWAASLVLIPGLHQMGNWSSLMPTKLLVLNLSGKAVTSARRAQQNHSLGSCPAWNRSKFPFVLWISVNSIAKGNLIQVAALHPVSETNQNSSFLYKQPPKSTNKTKWQFACILGLFGRCLCFDAGLVKFKTR